MKSCLHIITFVISSFSDAGVSQPVLSVFDEWSVLLSKEGVSRLPAVISTHLPQLRGKKYEKILSVCYKRIPNAPLLLPFNLKFILSMFHKRASLRYLQNIGTQCAQKRLHQSNQILQY